MLLNIIQIIISILLTTTILLQQKGSGLSSTFGGGGGEGNIYRTKRGVEKILFTATILLAIAFIGTTLIRIII